MFRVRAGDCLVTFVDTINKLGSNNVLLRTISMIFVAVGRRLSSTIVLLMCDYWAEIVRAVELA